jgi:hypothetical protein
MENISLEQLYIIKKINELYVRKGFFDKTYNILFGGSISLLSCGLMNRSIGDIDIFTADEKIYKDLIKNIYANNELGPSKFSNCKSNDYNHVTLDKDLNQISRTGLTIRAPQDKLIKLCIFLVPKDQIKSYNMYQISSGLSIPVQQINYAIHAKILYAQRSSPSGEKHKMDIENVYAILNSAFFMISGEELT